MSVMSGLAWQVAESICENALAPAFRNYASSLPLDEITVSIKPDVQGVHVFDNGGDVDVENVGVNEKLVALVDFGASQWSTQEPYKPPRIRERMRSEAAESSENTSKENEANSRRERAQRQREADVEDSYFMETLFCESVEEVKSRQQRLGFIYFRAVVGSHWVEDPPAPVLGRSAVSDPNPESSMTPPPLRRVSSCHAMIPSGWEPPQETIECQICFLSLPEGQNSSPCVNQECGVVLCVACVEELVRTRLQGCSKYAVPSIRCPDCDMRIPTAQWWDFADKVTRKNYTDAMNGFFADRCPQCDWTTTTFPDERLCPKVPPPSGYSLHSHEAWDAATVLKSIIEDVFDGVSEHNVRTLLEAWSECDRTARDAASLQIRRLMIEEVFDGVTEQSVLTLMEAWRGYDRGDISVSSFLSTLLHILMTPTLEMQESDPFATFMLAPEQDSVPDWVLRLFYMTEDSEPNVVDVWKTQFLITRLICDPERRFNLLLCFLKKFPRLSRLGCECRRGLCFSCKTRPHSTPCDVLQKKLLKRCGDARACPGCGVPTIRMDGCSDIICICGERWTWPESQRDSATDEDEDEDEDEDGDEDGLFS